MSIFLFYFCWSSALWSTTWAPHENGVYISSIDGASTRDKLPRHLFARTVECVISMVHHNLANASFYWLIAIILTHAHLATESFPRPSQNTYNLIYVAFIRAPSQTHESIHLLLHNSLGQSMVQFGRVSSSNHIHLKLIYVPSGASHWWVLGVRGDATTSGRYQ